MGVKVSIKAKRNSTRRYRSPLISTALPSTTLRDRTTPVAERSRSAKVHQLSDSRNTGCKLVSCGQKSTKICSNRSNRIFCLICCLFDFSRSGFLKISH